jgi:hypothetical protein
MYRGTGNAVLMAVFHTCMCFVGNAQLDSRLESCKWYDKQSVAVSSTSCSMCGVWHLLYYVRCSVGIISCLNTV